MQNTSETAQVYKCLYATNGGYFAVSTGACIGNLITDGKVIQVRSHGYSIQATGHAATHGSTGSRCMLMDWK